MRFRETLRRVFGGIPFPDIGPVPPCGRIASVPPDRRRRLPRSGFAFGRRAVGMKPPAFHLDDIQQGAANAADT